MNYISDWLVSNHYSIFQPPTNIKFIQAREAQLARYIPGMLSQPLANRSGKRLQFAMENGPVSSLI